MIKNDTELALVRERLRLVEDALDALCRDVKSKNEIQYRLLAASHIELLLSIRADLDAYLGIDPQGALKADSLAPTQVPVRAAG